MKKHPAYASALILLCLLLLSGCAAKQKMAGEPIVETPQAAEVPQAAPVEPPAPVVVPAVEVPAPTVELERIHFDYNRYALSEQARVILAANVDVLKANPELKIDIEGYCDSRGSDEYNMALGERRALAAKAFLVAHGIEAQRVQVVSFGEEHPLDLADNETAWAKNRRAEFKRID